MKSITKPLTGDSPPPLARCLRAWLCLALTFLPGAVWAQVTGSIVSFGVTNYEGFIVAGDIGNGGRQAIQTSTVMFYTNSSHLLATNIFKLAYQLFDEGGNLMPIRDEKGNSNVTYSVFQTNIVPQIFLPAYSLTNNAPLQPLERLSPYDSYIAAITVYSGPATANPILTPIGQSATGTPEQYYDFTNAVSPDASPNLLLVMDNAYLVRSWAISNSPAQSGFPVEVGMVVARYDDFTLPPYETNTTVMLDFQLLNTATGASVPLQSSQAVFNVSIASHDGSSPPNPVVVELTTNFLVIPAVQLDSVDNTYQIVVTLAHTEGPAVVSDYTNALPSTRLLDFNGQLYFGPLLTYFTNLDMVPSITGTVAGDHLDCLMEVSTNSGLLPEASGQTYGAGTNLAVMLLTNGTAEIAPGAVVMMNNQGVATGNRSSQNISFQTSSLELTSAGASENVTLILPVGFSVAFLAPNNRLTLGAIPLGNIPLNQNLAFATNVLTTPGPFQAVHESLPFWFYASSMQWSVDSGTLSASLTGGTFARQTEDDVLTANQAVLTYTNTANRVSNDGYFRNATAGISLVVTADANGMARVTCQLGLNPAELRPHFPYSGNGPGQQIEFDRSGLFSVQQGTVSPGSFLPLGQPAPVSYARDTSDTNCSASLAGPATLPFTSSNNFLGFTVDGGLLAVGTTPQTNLTWGYVDNGHYAQEALNVSPCIYEMAGTFLSGGQTSVDPNELPAALLLSGFGRSANEAYVERPGNANYDAGLASYPGLNFSAPANGSSYLAGEINVTYPLAPEAKYYARYGGISGIHDASPFPSGTLVLYGYNFTFSAYRLSFLDSEVDKSLTDGAISFPFIPAGFTEEFSDLKFSGRGYLESAQVPASSTNKHLNYWNVDFTPESIEFASSTNDSCGTGQRWLVLGVETQLPFITEKLHASLGFWPTGNLVSAADGVSGCDSRFAVPAKLSLQGPGSSSFVLCTASEGYFNNWTPTGPSPGFYNLAGKLRVPFFEDVRVHLHITSLVGSPPQLAIMGGWPDPSTGVANYGWNSGTNNFFNTAKFDPAAAGYPADQGVSISAYEGAQAPLYHPVAQRDWIQVAIFDYSLNWDSTLHQFEGAMVAPVILPVINVDSRLKKITPGKVDLDFSQDVSLQIPVMKVLDLLGDATGEGDGALQSLSNAVQSALGKAFDTGGLNELQDVLREDPTTLFQPILNSACSAAVDQIYTNLSKFPQGNEQAFLSNAVFQVQNNSALKNALNQINGAPGRANSLVGKLDGTLTDAQNDLNQFIQILGKSADGKRHAVSKIIQQLLSDQARGLGYASVLTSSLGSEVDGLVSGLDPTLGELQGEFQTLSNQFAKTHASLTNATGDFAKSLIQAAGDATSAQQFVQSAALNVSNLLSSALTPAGDYFTADPAAAKQAIQQQLQDAFLSSPLSSDYQQTVRQFVFDDNAVIDELMDTTFDQINNAMRDALGNLVDDATDTVFNGLKNMTNDAPGGASLLTAKIRGAPTFNGDSLRKIHLNAAVEMDVPNKMNFNAYMEIKELNSQSVAVDCIPAGAPAAEVTLGAKNVKLDWASLNDNGTPLRLTLDAKWTLQSGNVIGVGGLIDIKGDIGFQGCSVNEIGATMAFGAGNYYFAAKAAGTITVIFVPVGVEVGVFVGKACSLSPILFIDPQATDVLGPDQAVDFEGIYVAASANLSLSEILFGESSCELDVGVTESVGLFYTGHLPTLTAGMRVSTAVDASLLCLLSATGDLTMTDKYTATLSPPQFNLTLGGTAQICGSIGPCPFCISGCKSVGVYGQVGTGGVRYSLSY